MPTEAYRYRLEDVIHVTDLDERREDIVLVKSLDEFNSGDRVVFDWEEEDD